MPNILESLKTSEVFYKHLAELTPEAIIVHMNGVILYANKATLRLIGAKKKSEVVGKNVMQFIHPDSVNLVKTRVQKMRNKKKPMPVVEEKLITMKGETISAKVKAVPIMIKDEQAILVILQDITEHNRAVEQMSRLAAIVDSSDDAIVSKTLKGIITSWNASAEKLFGYTAREAIGMSILNIIPPELQAEEKEIIRKISSGKRIHHFETVRMKKNGERVNVSLSISPVKDSTGKIVGASKIARDITERTQIERKKDEFIGIASHELKTPLTSVKGYIQILDRVMRDTNNIKAKVLLQKTNTYIDRLSGLISDLLDVSRIQSGKLQYTMADFDVYDLVKDGVEAIQPTLNRHKIVVESNIHEIICGDKNRLEQVFINLLTNAIKYSPEADKVIVKVATNRDKVEVSVQDFGIGVPAESVSHLFEKFYRVEKTANKFSGLGIGLYISYEIVRRHSGDMMIQSMEGQGSTFSFSIPKKK